MARLLSKHKVLIQHIPRTGGTWQEMALDIAGIRVNRWLDKQPPWIPKKHALLNHYHRRQLMQAKYVAAFVRHPIAYYESIWKWLSELRPRDFKTIETRWNWHPKRSVARHYSKDFNAWVFAVLKAEPLWYTRLVEQYVGPEGGEFCDFIGRTETLTEDFLDLLSIVGYGEEVEKARSEIVSLKPQNTRKKLIEWDRDLRDKVQITEYSVIRRFYGTVLGVKDRRLYNWLHPDNLKRLEKD